MAEFRRLVGTLMPRTQIIIKLLNGVGTELEMNAQEEMVPRKYTLVEIGQFLGVTKERVRQISLRAMKILKGELDHGQGEEVAGDGVYYADHRDVVAVTLIHARPTSPDWEHLMQMTADELRQGVAEGRITVRRLPPVRNPGNSSDGLTQPLTKARAHDFFTHPDTHWLLRGLYQVWPRLAVGWYAAGAEYEQTFNFWEFVDGHDNIDGIDVVRRVTGTALIWIGMVAWPFAVAYGLTHMIGLSAWLAIPLGLLLIRPLLWPSNVLTHGLIMCVRT
jgi:hypothetical protein